MTWAEELIHSWDGKNVSRPILTEIGVENYPARIITYETSYLKQKMVLIIAPNAIFILRFGSRRILFEDREGIFNHMLSSFELHNP